ncbi:MAG: PAS domain S-box protein [Anaerolineae bacterium]|nr:PAS domain S-box protein [Anaerolineae bacterium]
MKGKRTKKQTGSGTSFNQRLLLILSQAAQAVQRAHTPEDVYRTICEEIAGLGYHASIFDLTEDRTQLAASYMTFSPSVVQAAEKLTGLIAHDYRIPVTPGGFYHRIISNEQAVFSDPGGEPISEALPKAVGPLAGRLATLLDIGKAIYVPLKVGDEVHSLMTVMGADLTERDVATVAAFASQAAIALENARLYQAAQHEIAERKHAEALLRAQRDLALELGTMVELDQTLKTCVEAAIRIAGVDVGGVYLVDEASGDLDLAFAAGVSADFLAAASHYAPDSSNARLVMQGKPLYINYQKPGVPIDGTAPNEVLRATAVLPIHHEGQIIACLNVASREFDEIPLTVRDTLETIATQIGSAVTRARAETAAQENAERLRQNEATLRSIFRAAPAGIGVVYNRTLGWTNDLLRQMTGYSGEELAGQSARILYPSDEDYEYVGTAKYAQIREHGGGTVETRFQHKDGTIIDILLSSTALDPEDLSAGVVFTALDISEQKRAEAALRKHVHEIERFNRLATGREQRIIELKRQVNALARAANRPPPYEPVEQRSETDNELEPDLETIESDPHPDKPAQEYELADLIDLDQMQHLLDSFGDAAGISSAIADQQGKILISTHWQRLCTDFHRVNAGTYARCMESEAILGEQAQHSEQVALRRCPNGLADAAAPIVIAGKHAGYAFVGQFLLEPPDEAFFLQQAREYGFDQAAYMAALTQVPIISQEQLPALFSFLTSATKLVATIGLERIQAKKAESALARRAKELDRVNRELVRQREAAMNLAQDIDEARLAAEQAGKALQESESRFRTLSEASPAGVYIVQDDRFQYVNPALAAIFGYTPEALIGKMGSLDLIHPSHRPFVAESMRQRLAGESESDHYTALGIRQDGELIHIEVLGRRIDHGGRPALMGNVLDISKRIQAEAERERLLAQIQEQARQMQQIVDTVPEGVLLLDAENRVILANPVGEQDIALLSKARIGDTLTALHAVPLSDLATWPNDTSWHDIHTQERTFEAIMRPVQSAPQALRWVLVIRDLTHEREMQERVRHRERLAAIGQLAGGVAHDFNNLLTAIRGYTQFALDELSSGDPIRSDLEEVQAASDRATTLTRQLLAFSRRQVLRPRVLDLNAVIVDMEKMLYRLIGEDVELTTTLDRSLGQVKADPGQIEQVIVNLCVNARDAMPQGGKLVLATENAILDAHDCQQHIEVEPGAYVMLTVSDTGIGMDETIMAHLFEPFFTTKREGEGTGLGLATVHGIIKQSGGHIEVDSEPGRGTTFRIYLPQGSRTPQTHMPAAPDNTLPRGTETILMAEDEEVVRSLAHRILTRQGYRVLTAEHVEAVLHLSIEYDKQIDLLITDVVMPGMNGPELAERVMASRPEIKVLYMSGHTDESLERRGMLAPEVALLEKPFTQHALTSKVREVLDQ